MLRRSLLIWLALVASLLVSASAAQAVVVQMGAATETGVALVPGSSLPASISRAQSSTACNDPWLSADLGGPGLPSGALCWQGGAVMHANETFALTWDPPRRDWQTTRNYVEQYLRDVADGSGTGSSPFALTPQYKDGGGPADRAANASLYGGGCIDYGSRGGASCQFTNAVGNAPGTNYPTSGNCPVTGSSYPAVPNDTCLTDAQIQAQVTNTITEMGLVNHIQPGYTPLLVMLTPPGVEVCLDAAGKLCSANSDPKSASAQFCSYHSELQVGSTKFAYVVQPWTAYTACDDPNVPALTSNPTAQQLAVDVGSRLVSPLSQGQLAAITNPWLNGWFGHDASEINDNGPGGCAPVKPGDKATIGNSGQNPYFVKAAFNNAGGLEFDPNDPACALGVELQAGFVVPSPIDQGDVVAFDGSVSVSTLMVPQSGYAWNFGDGNTATGASVVHAYAKGGTYTVTLDVTDRGGYRARVSQTITVLGPDGQPVTSTPSGPSGSTGLHARLQLMPQSLGTVLRSGIAIVVSSNQSAAGFATLSIPRNAARRAHIRTGRGPTVVIGRGTIARIAAGTSDLRLRLSRATAAKLARVGHTALTVRLALVAAGGHHLAIVAAGHY